MINNVFLSASYMPGIVPNLFCIKPFKSHNNPLLGSVNGFPRWH